MASCTGVLPESTLDVLRGVPLTEEQAREISARGEEAVVFVLLELMAEQKGKTAAGSHQTAGTPSGMKPPYRKPPGRHWPAFAKKLRRLLGDAIRLWRRREQLPKTTYASRRRRLEIRLQQLIDTPWNDAHAKRLVKRLRRHRNDLFTFLDQPGVPFDNNAAERAIRPAVTIRKNSYGNRSARGADCQAVLMSIFRTLKGRGHDPIRTVVGALATYLTTGQLPPLPGPARTSGILGNYPIALVFLDVLPTNQYATAEFVLGHIDNRDRCQLRLRRMSASLACLLYPKVRAGPASPPHTEKRFRWLKSYAT